MAKMMSNATMGTKVTTTNTKEIWINGSSTDYISLNKPKKVKGTNYSKGHVCMECDRPRNIRGKLCDKCRYEILKKAG